MPQTKPNVGAVVKVTTKWPNINLWSDEPFYYNTYEGVVIRSDPWNQPDTFKLLVANPVFPNPVIALHNVSDIEYISGSGSAVSDSVKTITVKGSKGAVYTVSKVGDQWQCTCPGYTFRKACKHLEAARNAKA